ncbi:HEPN domain-containing protein [Kribbella sindirgiensis]|uniref:HEPN domain-containing protein n=1 Tax=Kribbella sindirgiensis TaxID=1124744 RepID=A0A4R0IUI4_9ACTN|nr:HEPN domain-containing protein [Kribbella sindirgiensis]TCC36817.1 HEPN domain-containing protein [Kribbella sindirgiensis]
MPAIDDARAHLTKAREFLEAAQLTNDLQLYNAAASNAVTSGINSKDAICLALTGHTRKSDNHTEAVVELKRAGAAGRDSSATLSRLLKLKSRSQYQASSVSAADATKSIDWAARLLDTAESMTLI